MRWWGYPSADARVRSRNIRPPGMNISFCVGRSAPPDSTSEITGSRFCSTISLARNALPQRPRVAGAAPDGRVVGDDHAFDALDHADPDDDARAHLKFAAPRGKRAQFQERGVLVEQEVDAFAGGELAALAVPGESCPAAAGEGLRELRLDLVQFRRHRLGRGAILRRLRVERGSQCCHERSPIMPDTPIVLPRAR